MSLFIYSNLGKEKGNYKLGERGGDHIYSIGEKKTLRDLV
jgi:hypothetical protein